MKHISPILAAILSRHGLEQGIVDRQIFLRWDEILGDLSRRTRPLEIRGRELWIQVDHAPLMQHLGFLAPRIMVRLRELVPGTTVQRLRFTLKG